MSQRIISIIKAQRGEAATTNDAVSACGRIGETGEAIPKDPTLSLRNCAILNASTAKIAKDWWGIERPYH